jgi:nitrite reductase/ring-hydroxylating ferredoxin subunit
MLEVSTNSTAAGTTDKGGASRRALFAGVGAVGAAALLSACSDDDNGTMGAPATSGPAAASPPAGGQSAPAASPSGGGGSGTVVAQKADIPVGGGKIFADRGVVVTQPTAGTFKAFSSICTHEQCPLADVSGGTINCNCHFSKFSITDGSVVSPPADQPLPPFTIAVEGNDIKLV